ncbi:MAG: tRNA (adenosine(37)-N6)-dimethylallyltransferase MiaA [Candidatus Omnitrophica bacterium]|nr:tRNA (adenosine(37)-N6)-dimethylallyltransferase MiaA [Candidatus Omnitrophota bacterium]
MKKKVICLIGPTAVGKTDVALSLARKLGAEIISCDSMQVYKSVKIASAKPNRAQRRSIPHHLIDIIPPSQEFDVARFCSLARKAISAIHKKDKIPLLVGGTGLYLQALLDGLFKGPGQNPDLRRKLYSQAEKYGCAYCYKRLKRLDPQAACAIHPHDLRRIVRALEVYLLSGKTITELKKRSHGLKDRFDCYLFGLQRNRNLLYQRIEKRVESMFRRGLVAEMRRLKRRKVSKTAQSLLGYKEVLGFLNGRYSLEEAKRLLKLDTRRYAKRQLSWFRREKGIRWIEVGPEDAPEAIAESIISILGC